MGRVYGSAQVSYSANEAVEMAEEESEKKAVSFVAHEAARYVAAGDMGRNEAVIKVTNYLRLEAEADGDVTGTVGVENVLPEPSTEAPDYQVRAIAAELMASAREAVEALQA